MTDEKKSTIKKKQTVSPKADPLPRTSTSTKSADTKVPKPQKKLPEKPEAKVAVVKKKRSRAKDTRPAVNPQKNAENKNRFGWGTFASIFGFIVGVIALSNFSNGFTQWPMQIGHEKPSADNSDSTPIQTEPEADRIKVQETTKNTGAPRNIKLLPESITAQEIINTDNAESRYRGWSVPPGGWGGKIHNIDVFSDKTWYLYTAVEPGAANVFVLVRSVPPGLKKGDYIEFGGEIVRVDPYMRVTSDDVKKTNPQRFFRKHRVDYDVNICVQKRLKEYGYGILYVDGIAGTNTKNAVSRFLSRSPVLKELGLSTSAQVRDICEAVKGVPPEDYKKLVNEKIAADHRKKYTALYKPIDYEERYYKDLEKTDKEKFDKANRFSDLVALYEYLQQSHLKYTMGDADRLRQSKGFLQRQATAKKKLGITFDPRKVNLLNQFINDNKPSGVQYEVKVSVDRDKGYYFHNGKAVHGISECMDMRILKNCQAGAICTDKDIKNHYYGYMGQCVNLELEYGVAGIKLDTRRYDDLCERLKTYINKKTGHRAELTISETSQGRNCFMHYDVAELNRLLSSP